MYNQWPYYQFPNPYALQGQPHIQNNQKQNKKSEPEENGSRKSEDNSDQQSIKASLVEVIEKLYDKMNKIEQENQQLKEKIDNIKPVTIENVNYKIQDLSVQELSGTLLVGLTSLTDADEFKKLLTENGPVSINDIDTKEFEDMSEKNGEEPDPNNDGNNGNESIS